MGHTFKHANHLLFLALFGLVFFSLNPLIPRDALLPLYDSKRVLLIILVELTALTLLFSSKARLAIYKEWHSLSRLTRGIVSLFALSSLIATLNATYPVSAVTQWLYLLGLVALVFLFKQECRAQQLRILQYFLWISVLLFLSVALVFWFRLSHLLVVDKHAIWGFSNARFLNQIHVWLLIPTAYLLIARLQRSQSTLLLRFLLIADFAVIVATDARGPAVAIIVGFLLMSWLDAPRRKIWWTLLWQSALLGILFKLFLLEPIPSYLLGIEAEWHTLRTDSSGRVTLWLEALSMTTFWGQGGNAFVCDSTEFGRPHNSVLNVWVHWGLISMTCFCFLACAVLFKVIKTNNLRTRMLGVNLLVGLAYSLVSGVLDSPLSQLMAVLCLGMFWGRLIPKANEIRGHFRLLSLATITLSLATLVAMNYRLYERLDAYPAFRPEAKIKTQFWLGHNCLEKPWSG
ncbi:O-antigen ligase family protein [Vibrio coralliilyticus]|uniref:O-antigen ligase family protein n=1 Tax=Vibrio coralliilyticus TaxID=190893 RepID=UPI0015610595|nr:O-antigen ligase family protein [Vibrio coralliilyticus]NRF62904.1 O-antigen ligase family protein [Vibrio coralliilyticus]